LIIRYSPQTLPATSGHYIILCRYMEIFADENHACCKNKNVKDYCRTCFV